MGDLGHFQYLRSSLQEISDAYAVEEDGAAEVAVGMWRAAHAILNDLAFFIQDNPELTLPMRPFFRELLFINASIEKSIMSPEKGLQ